MQDKAPQVISKGYRTLDSFISIAELCYTYSNSVKWLE